MRIIGGKHRGRNLLRVGKITTRETADMVKESVFNMIGGTVSGQVLDLFAGSGAYGLEAISRGAEHLFAVDNDKDAVKTIITNAKSMKEEASVTVVLKDVIRFLSTLDQTKKFDVVFIDPPYDLIIYLDVLNILVPFLNDDAYVVCESKRQVVFEDQIQSLVKIKERVYGIKRITIYQKNRADE
ncbi:MAG: 16S rRNA (guanine(966)-N(2))-methyltransferase RsmD [Tenericutes bacterium HGW-Tenericutes-7]|nr:MAG: 16S rRNA (guanine(966)-N(2))-methyltransferase RsmD [Tenericutes bacterium HGW-Tenericutes-7]PKK96594.1 MAG: 16S rRNA (guanine(966)-N(2))-methyltransferase RsmD [Tenericutes bacterium HGW-Tenericutes-3]